MTTRKLLIEHPKGTEFIPLADIIYFQAKDNWTIIALKRHSYRQVCQTLKTIEERINSDHFMRVHRSYLVNLDQVDKIQGCYEELKMTESHTVPVSRRRKKELKQALKTTMSLM